MKKQHVCALPNLQKNISLNYRANTQNVCKFEQKIVMDRPTEQDAYLDPIPQKIFENRHRRGVYHINKSERY